MKLLYIDQYRYRLGVEPTCAVLSEYDMKIARETYYKWLQVRVRSAEPAEALLVNEIVDLHRANRSVYGVRKMWHAVPRAGLGLRREQVARLVRIAGLRRVRRGEHRATTTMSESGVARHSDLVKRGWKTPAPVIDRI